jgi:hypothetical protein
MKGKVKYSFEIFLEFELVKETVDRLLPLYNWHIFINFVAVAAVNARFCLSNF